MRKGTGLKSAAALIFAVMMQSAPPSYAQLNLNIENYGMRIPQPATPSRELSGRNNTFNIPGLAPTPGAVAPVVVQVPGVTPGATTMAPIVTSRRRSIEDPTVSKNNIGFYNESSDQTLKFQLLVGGASRTVTLQPHQVITIDVDPPAELKGVLNTDGRDPSETPFSLGELYVLRAEGGKWVFAKL
ncbi:hypothetical protein AAE026_29350 [Bradyrhizobium sp. DN5]|uniref:hypothetical protein n=1 Tax=Bradyrhizobium sp. DN5 TaxID=3056950 RepID=UPI0035258209